MWAYLSDLFLPSRDCILKGTTPRTGGEMTTSLAMRGTGFDSSSSTKWLDGLWQSLLAGEIGRSVVLGILDLGSALYSTYNEFLQLWVILWGPPNITSFLGCHLSFPGQIRSFSPPRLHQRHHRMIIALSKFHWVCSWGHLITGRALGMQILGVGHLSWQPWCLWQYWQVLAELHAAFWWKRKPRLRLEEGMAQGKLSGSLVMPGPPGHWAGSINREHWHLRKASSRTECCLQWGWRVPRLCQLVRLCQPRGQGTTVSCPITQKCMSRFSWWISGLSSSTYIFPKYDVLGVCL